MINFKRLTALSLSAVCLLMSCNKSVNADGIKNFIKSTYGDSVKVKTFKEANINMKITCKDNVKEYCNTLIKGRADYYGIKYEDNSLSFDGKVVSEEGIKFLSSFCENKITTEEIDEYEEAVKSSNDISCSYLISGNEMSILYQDNNYKEENVEEKFNELFIYNNCGQMRYMKVVEDFEKDTKGKKYTKTSIVTFAFND